MQFTSTQIKDILEEDLGAVDQVKYDLDVNKEERREFEFVTGVKSESKLLKYNIKRVPNGGYYVSISDLTNAADGDMVRGLTLTFNDSGKVLKIVIYEGKIQDGELRTQNLEISDKDKKWFFAMKMFESCYQDKQTAWGRN